MLSVATWLTHHPTVTLACRDQSDLYAEGIRRGAPNAIQVVDRFHFVQNLREAVESLLVNQRSALQKAAEHTAQALAPSTENVPATPMYRGRRNSPQTWKERLAADSERRNAPRIAAYKAVHALQAQQTPVATIARLIGISRQTVYTYLWRNTPPGPKQPQFRRSSQVLTPYVPYLLRRWREGCVDSAQLWREIQLLGEEHSARTVSRFITALRRVSAMGQPPEQQLSPFTRPQDHPRGPSRSCLCGRWRSAAPRSKPISSNFGKWTRGWHVRTS